MLSVMVVGNLKMAIYHCCMMINLSRNSYTLYTEAVLVPTHVFTNIGAFILSTKCICTNHRKSRHFAIELAGSACLGWFD